MKILKSAITSTILLIMSHCCIAQANGYKEVQLTDNTFDNRYASYNKSGDLILFESNRDGHWQIYTMDVNGNHQKRLINSVYNDRRPAWNPLKNIILFESDRSGTNELYKLYLDTNTIQKIPMSLNGNKSFGQFAPNGVDVVFNYENSSEDIDIYSITHNGKRQKMLVDDTYKKLRPIFSPKGNSIVYYTNKNNTGDTDVIYVYNLFLKEKNKLTYFKDQSQYPAYSNTGRRIAYSTSYKDEQPEIYIMDSDGDNKKRITFNDTEDILPYWSPKDINILVSRLINNRYQICKILLKEPL
ncbi:hypothetical protein V8G69_13970 [Gaetbulibacter sp. M235]|uniref:TolB family protein n=1 Tax=Gaetbulibacter sp. M235 TaxID=3126510 RepID=UPI00374F2C7E